MKMIRIMLVVLVIGIGICGCTKKEKTIDFGDGITMEFVLIPAGGFDMGAPKFEKDSSPFEGPVHRVEISKAFYMSKYEVTQAQYEAVVGENPSEFKGKDHPVECVSCNDAVAFCKKLGKNYRLPTEEEWEYSCRAGTTTRFYYGNDFDYSELDKYAWYDDNSGYTSHPVGQKIPNAFGLYDMHGNVLEWCSNWHFGGYDDTEEDYFRRPSQYNLTKRRALRGGSWLGTRVIRGSYPEMCRSAYRDRNVSSYRISDVGFRVVLELN